MKNSGLNCLCQYEKVFKKLGGEDAMLAPAGGSFLRNQLEATRDGQPDLIQQVQINIPLGWRGYVSEPDSNLAFPSAAGGSGTASYAQSGLDNAKSGDILVWPVSGSRFPRVAYVVEANNAAAYGGDGSKSGNYIGIVDSNYGKYPDACGNTSMLGYGPKRYLYKAESNLPASTQKLYKQQLVYTTGCEDGSTFQCVEKDWGNVRIFRPSKAPLRSVGGSSSFSIPGFGGASSGGGSSGGGGLFGGGTGGLPSFLGPLLGSGH